MDIPSYIRKTALSNTIIRLAKNKNKKVGFQCPLGTPDLEDEGRRKWEESSASFSSLFRS